MNEAGRPLRARLQIISGHDHRVGKMTLHRFGKVLRTRRFAVEDRAQLSAMAGEPDDLDAAVRAFFRDTIRDNLRLP